MEECFVEPFVPQSCNGVEILRGKRDISECRNERKLSKEGDRGSQIAVATD
jgi:hypothetical protein